MTVTYESVMSSALQLNPLDRCRMASSLLESVHSLPTETDEEWEAVLDQREADLENDLSLEISHEAFIGHFSQRRRS